MMYNCHESKESQTRCKYHISESCDPRLSDKRLNRISYICFFFYILCSNYADLCFALKYFQGDKMKYQSSSGVDEITVPPSIKIDGFVLTHRAKPLCEVEYICWCMLSLNFSVPITSKQKMSVSLRVQYCLERKLFALICQFLLPFFHGCCFSGFVWYLTLEVYTLVWQTRRFPVTFEFNL